MRRTLSSVAALALGLSAGAAANDVVERRGTDPALTGAIVRVDDEGVTVASEDGDEQVVPWDRVRRIVPDRPRSDLARWEAVSEDLWRARSRLERGDTFLAEPLFERLFYGKEQGYRGRTHATARLVAEGLARCYLAHGANDRAVIPVLETIRLERAGVGHDAYASLAPIIDPETGLCPELPPVWVASRHLPKLETSLQEYTAGGDATVGRIAALYGAALGYQRGAEAPGWVVARDGAASTDEGVAFLTLIVESFAPTVEPRAAARQRLEDRLEALAPWAEGWARFALGASLLREPGTGRRQRGTVHLVHLPARFRSSQPFLAGLALSLASASSRAGGDDSAAAVFDAELRRWYPNHPVLLAAPAFTMTVRPQEQN